MGARTCLVTGGAGFIGCNISRALADSFDLVVAVDNLHRQVHPTGQRPSELDPRVQLIEADVAESGVLDAVVRDLRPS
ncbi:NAD-dependent epimerase/dehydratase family protein, partial [Acinetobacter baumannii]